MVCRYSYVTDQFNVVDIFLQPMRTSENQRFSDVLRWYWKGPMAWNGLNNSSQSQITMPQMVWRSFIRKNWDPNLLRHQIFPSHKNQFFDLHSKSMDWFLYDRDLRRERVNGNLWSNCLSTFNWFRISF